MKWYVTINRKLIICIIIISNSYFSTAFSQSYFLHYLHNKNNVMDLFGLNNTFEEIQIYQLMVYEKNHNMEQLNTISIRYNTKI